MEPVPAKVAHYQIRAIMADEVSSFLAKLGLLPVVVKYQDHCLFRAVSAGVVGISIGVGLGTFVGTMVGAHGEIRGDTLAEQLRTGFGRSISASMSRGYQLGRGFGIAGAVFVATECSIEKWRARHDIYNSVFGGLTAGAALGAWNKRMGPSPALARSVAMNAAQFAALAVVFELGSHALQAHSAR